MLFLFTKERQKPTRAVPFRKGTADKSAVPFCKGTAKISQKVLSLFAKEQSKSTHKRSAKRCCSFSQRNSKAKVLFLFAKEQQKFTKVLSLLAKEQPKSTQKDQQTKSAVPFRKGTAKIHTQKIQQKVLFLFAKEQQSKSAVPFRKGTAKIHKNAVPFEKEQRKFKSAVPFEKEQQKFKSVVPFEKEQQKFKSAVPFEKEQQNHANAVPFEKEQQNQGSVMRNKVKNSAITGKNICTECYAQIMKTSCFKSQVRKISLPLLRSPN
jgi:hypothetical protein